MNGFLGVLGIGLLDYERVLRRLFESVGCIAELSELMTWDENSFI